MLPELLFPVMQDISRDEFSILSGSGVGSGILGTASGATVCDNSLLSQTNLIKSPIKLEDLENYSLSSWKSPNLCNLLRNSEDPLISGGTTNDNQNELKPITEPPSPPITPTTPTKQTAATPRNRKAKSVRRKGQVKLRFHHQALPQEYLEHYETQNRKQNKKSDLNDNDDGMEDEEHKTSVRNWLQKIKEVQDDDISLSLIKNEPELENIKIKVPPQQSTSSRVYNYSDLPYMGEMTLENSKPRRGRKPKKADICHLIYKNYGQIFPGTPTNSQGGVGPMVNTNNNTKSKAEKVDDSSKKTAIQNKILSSLLEKRLTQNLITSKKISNEKPKQINLQAEPLNLCLRDGRRHPSSPMLSTPTLSPTSSSISLLGDDDDDDETLLAINSKRPLDIAKDPLLAGEKVKSKKITLTDHEATPGDGYVYWPAGNVFINPMALYYQKMADGSGANGKIHNSPIPSGNKTTTKSTTPTTSSAAAASMKNTLSSSSATKTAKLVAKDISELMAKRDNSKSMSLLKPPTPSTTPSSVKSMDSVSSQSSSTTASSNNLRTVILSSTSSSPLSNNQNSNQTQKRKRSAIFIPPMPSENTSNPATEVSICKFKFTGGAKPSLQEKKMLSVDSGGNFRYYSGTGDKSMRGYEFFPRESLQQSSLASGGSSTGAFLNTPGEKIITEEPYPSLDLTSDVLQIPSFSPPSSVASSPAIIVTTPDQSPALPTSSSSTTVSLAKQKQQSSTAIIPVPHHSNARTSLDRKSKRKSRRSLQREKLEKTFKEKGFLIQTEHVEAAGGTTYCKFRQLRRFTRYLFRSWKDYLPGDIQQSGANQV